MVCRTTKVIGHTAKMNRRYSGIKVNNPKTNANTSTKTEPEMKKRIPKPNAASTTSLPTGVCAKETTLGKVSTRGIRRKSEKPFEADPKYFISVALSSRPPSWRPLDGGVALREFGCFRSNSFYIVLIRHRRFGISRHAGSTRYRPFFR